MTEMHLHFMIVKHVFLIKIHETKIIIELDLNSGLSTSMHYNKLETSPAHFPYPSSFHRGSTRGGKLETKIQVSAEYKISTSLPRRGNSAIPPTRAFPRWILKF